MNSEHLDVLRDIRDDFLEDDSVDAVDIAALDAAIAVMSAQQPNNPVAADNEKAADRACLAMIAQGYHWNGEAWARAKAQQASTSMRMRSVEVALQKWLDWCNEHDEEPEAKSGARIAIEALAKSVAPVGVPVGVVREYLDARACYEAATRPPNSHARAPVLKHDDPDARRLREARVALDNAITLAQQPPAVAPVGVEGLVADLETIWHSVSDDKETNAAYQRLKAALAQQPPAVAPVGVEVKVLARDVHYAIRDAGLAPESPADDAAMRDAILRTLAQQPVAVDEAMVERIAALLHEEATDEPWAVAGVEHDGPDRDYYRTLARKVIDRAGKQIAAMNDLSAWRAAFVAERATRYRESGMSNGQARIHAETDTTRIDALFAQQRERHD